MFSKLPRLKDLRLACNDIRKVEDLIGFDKLLTLDLSYNALTLRSVQNLDVLPNLKELDLCGNNLKGLPMEMYRFRSLEKILLDNNKIDDNNIFRVLCTVTNLRYVSVAYNFLHKIPPECCEEGFFHLLTTLDVSFNYFSREDDLLPIVDLPRLLQAMIYGNPLLGPTGEDPQCIYIEDLVDAATITRVEQQKAKIDLITEILRKRNFKKGKSAGRHATYRDFSIVKVGGDYSSEQGPAKTNNEWREEGNKTLFAESIALAQKEKLMSSIPDNTFITASATNEDDAKILKMADNVMDRVAEDLDLTTSAEILYFQDKTRLNVNTDIGNGNNMNNGNNNYGGTDGDDDEDNLDPDMIFDDQYEDEVGPEANVSNKGLQDKVPAGMFIRTMADPSTLQTHPIAVKTAMRALQFAIRHPLTNYDEVPTKGGLPPKDYVRETAASKLRKLPKQKLSMKPQSEISKIKNKTGRGLGEPFQVTAARQKGREDTLHKIEAVLDKLNMHADDLSAKGAGNVNTKEGIDKMKHFARPQTGLRGLVKMVDEVVADLDA
jgi:hypothetical protein